MSHNNKVSHVIGQTSTIIKSKVQNMRASGEDGKIQYLKKQVWSVQQYSGETC